MREPWDPIIVIGLMIAASVQAETQAPLQLTIRAGSESGESKDRFKVGDSIVITLTMTNTSAAPVNICLSSNLYQNLPRLTKDGQLIPIMNWTSSVRRIAKHDETCKDINLPQKIAFDPKAEKDIDWFVLVDSSISTGAEAWYDSLQPGKYELSLQRRLDRCDGPMVESNKITLQSCLK